jgi:HK97 family phage major capsid protein
VTVPTVNEQLRTLREARASAWSEYRSLLDTIGGDPSAEQTQTLDRLDKQLSEQTSQIDRLERAGDWEARFSRPQQEPEVHRANPAADEYRAAYVNWLLTGEKISPQLETRALGVGTDSAGGYLAPDSFRNALIERMQETSVIRPWVTTITTDSGSTLSWPTADEVGVEGVILAENTQVAELDVDFGIATLDAYKYSSKLVRISTELIQDSAIDIEGYVARALADRINRIQNKHFTVGTGTGQPDGIAVGATVGVTAASTTAITTDELLDLVYSVDPAYRAGAAFMMNEAITKTIRKLKYSTDEYIWQPGLQSGAPDSLLGYPVRLNTYMDASPAAADVVALFGNFRAGYVIRDVRGMRTVRMGERYADYDQIGLTAFQRSDGTKQDVNAYKSLVMAAS